MIEIQVNNLVKSFEVGHNVLDGVTFQIDQGQRVGLLGKNGAGKSTLFKILIGELDCDEGTVTISPGHRMGLISQIPVYPEGYTVDDVLRSAFGRLHALTAEMEELAGRMAAGETDPAILKRYGSLSERFEVFGGYDTDVAISKVANGLSISDDMRGRLFDQLSGGEKTRVNLGRLILEDTDILLLDEPTNHLDLHATEWLEAYIQKFRGTVVAISHDRYFLDRSVNRVIEIENGKAEFYSGNYSFYAVEKERRYQERMKQYERNRPRSPSWKSLRSSCGCGHFRVWTRPIAAPFPWSAALSGCAPRPSPPRPGRWTPASPPRSSTGTRCWASGT